ncbi:midasin [Apis mellifera carnica]|nr:midasin [Apis mellifera carnica]
MFPVLLQFSLPDDDYFGDDILGYDNADSSRLLCLRNGTWLLLDQVNLCSPAILDRLNGLLEPNGALTIGEKGVDESGDVFTVRPHKDFRLFLAMDPRHGEISRAMRNRGVEISIPTPQNHGPLDRLDVVSLLNNCGIWNWAHRNSILEIHRSLYENRYRLNEMLQVASFTSRQMSKGFSFERSLRNSCRELCAMLDARSRHQAWDKIEGILSEENGENGERVHFRYDLDALTLRLCDLRTNSRLAIIKQQGFLFKSVVEKLRDDPRKIDLGDLFDEPPITDTKEFLKHLLLDFYERSSIDDLPIRRLWSSNIFSKNELEEFGRTNECLAKKVENSKLLFESGSDVPLYLIERSTLANNLSIKLYFQLMILDSQSGNRNVEDDEDVIRLKEYSSAVSSGRLSTNLRHETLILKFAEMTEQCRAIVDTILEQGDLPIDGKTCLELRDELKCSERGEGEEDPCHAPRVVQRARRFHGEILLYRELERFSTLFEGEREEEESCDDFQTSLVKKSTLCHLLYELFSPDRGEGATFGNYESRKKLLLAVRALLWRNSSALNSTEYDVSSNDSALLRFYINYYLSTVDEATIELNLNEKEDTDLTNRLLSPMNALRDIARSLETQDDPVSRGRGWMLLGYVQLFLFADLGPIDPVRKAALRSRYLGENVAELKRSVLIDRLQSTILGDKRCSVRTNRLKEARDRSERSGDHPVRPPSRLFSDLREEVENFSRNVASFRSTFDRVERLNELAIERSENETEERLRLSRERLHEAEIWRRSLERFSAKLERNYLPGFPDLVSPIVTAVSSLRHGLSILTNPNHSARPLSHDLLRFPVAGKVPRELHEPG